MPHEEKNTSLGFQNKQNLAVPLKCPHTAVFPDRPCIPTEQLRAPWVTLAGWGQGVQGCFALPDRGVSAKLCSPGGGNPPERSASIGSSDAASGPVFRQRGCSVENLHSSFRPAVGRDEGFCKSFLAEASQKGRCLEQFRTKSQCNCLLRSLFHPLHPSQPSYLMSIRAEFINFSPGGTLAGCFSIAS